MISEKIVKNIAKLARLSLTEKEIERMQKELSTILDYIDKLKEVDVSKTQPFLTPLKNVFREDVERRQKIIDQNIELIEMAPERKGSFIKVKSILK